MTAVRRAPRRAALPDGAWDVRTGVAAVGHYRRRTARAASHADVPVPRPQASAPRDRNGHRSAFPHAGGRPAADGPPHRRRQTGGPGRLHNCGCRGSTGRLPRRPCARSTDHPTACCTTLPDGPRPRTVEASYRRADRGHTIGVDHQPPWSMTGRLLAPGGASPSVALRTRRRPTAGARRVSARLGGETPPVG